MRSQACTLEGALAADRHREEQAREGESACPGGALNGIELKARVYATERLRRPARTIVRAHGAAHVFLGLYTLTAPAVLLNRERLNSPPYGS